MRRIYLAVLLSFAACLAPRGALADTRIGSAFAISGGKLLITNNHVIEGCAEIKLADLGHASVLKADPTADIAILKPVTPIVKALSFRGGHQVRLGEDVIVIGYPLRGVLASPPTVTTGIVSALAGMHDDHTQMQISAPVQPGNSGGPVLDRFGNVVGVVVSKLNAIKAAEATGDIPQNVNFAVQSSIVMSILDSYSIDYDSASATTQKPVADIVADALPAVVEVKCSTEPRWQAPPAVASVPEPQPSAPQPSPPQPQRQPVAPTSARTAAVCGREVDYSPDMEAADHPYGRFVGVWTGTWNTASRLCGAMVISKIETDGTADILYVYGPTGPGTRLTWRQQHVSAVIQPDGKLVFRDDQGSAFTFEMENPSLLNAFFGGAAGRLTAQFSKVN